MNAIFVDVIIDISVSSLDKVFQYHVPEELEPDIFTGCQVDVPFGRGARLLRGVVVGISQTPSIEADRIRDVAAVRKDAPGADGQLIRLASWLHRQTGATMNQALKTVLPVRKKVREKKDVTYCLTDRQAAMELLEVCRGNRREKARVRLLEALLKEGELPKAYVTGTLRISSSTLSAILRTGVMEVSSRQILRGSQDHLLRRWPRVVLNDAQEKAVGSILQHAGRLKDGWREEDAVHLLYGITGSGKTEVYISLIARMLEAGRQVIVLIPEISLTLQTVSRFYEYFGSRIAVMHSRLSAGERYDQYMRAASGSADIMIGPRSALFTPFDRLGLIIIDEEHDQAYKSEITPRYHAREAAIERAAIAGACVVLGSATPSVASLKKAQEGKYCLHRLPERARTGSLLPEVEVVDLREEFRMKNKGILSRSLKKDLKACLEHGDQAMLFLNRRGYAGFVSCRSCGHVLKCSHCDVALTAHYGQRLKCHYCGTESDLPKLCPACGSPYIASFGIGTQKVQEFVQKEFPGARILRLDRDTTAGKDDMARILRAFSEGKADILIGTQMIVKGHDFERVSLVGIIAADLSLHSGDYLASERTCQLLMQAAGRAGRGGIRGKVIIQTYQPDHYAVIAAAEQDYDLFFQQEMIFRKIMKYPPFSQLLMILVEGPDERETFAAAQRIRTVIGEPEGAEILGPSRAWLAKGRDLYRFVLYVKHPDAEQLIRLREKAEAEIADPDLFRNIYAGFDLNPMTLA